MTRLHNPTLRRMRRPWTIIGESCHKYFSFVLDVFCRDKVMFVATNIILSPPNLCRNEHIFVATKDLFCHMLHKTANRSLSALIIITVK